MLRALHRLPVHLQESIGRLAGGIWGSLIGALAITVIAAFIEHFASVTAWRVNASLIVGAVYLAFLGGSLSAVFRKSD